ncbi:MAG TPA: CPBP family intramembrane glutamic endopeptidase, partial [Candidatus Lokiarchaeia archaeon]
KVNPASESLKLYSMSKNKFKDQLLNGVLILFIVFIPLDFLIYFIFPEMLEYSGVVISSQKTDSYLLANYSIFLLSVIIIQISVSIFEETLTRGYLTKRGCDYFHKMSAVIIPSLYFGFMHFLYYLNPLSKNYPIWWPFIWFLNTLFVGILLSIFILKKKSIFPVIFAHAANNIISAHAIWCYLHGISFTIVTIYMYLPLLIVSAILFTLQFKKIKRALSNGLKFLKNYFKIDKHSEATKGDVYFRIFTDFLISILILIVGLFLV